LAAYDRADDKGCYAQVKNALFEIFVVITMIDDAKKRANRQVYHHTRK